MTEDLAAELRGLIAELAGQMEQPMPPALRQEQERGMAIALLSLRLLTRPGDEWTEGMQADLDKALHNVPKPLKGTASLAEASRYVVIRRDVEPWEVLIRWNRMPRTKRVRETVQVLANLWEDIIKGRQLGRPKKSLD